MTLRWKRPVLPAQTTLMAPWASRAICGSAAFTKAFRREMKRVFPDEKLERIAADAPIFTPVYGGANLSSVTRREPIVAEPGGPVRLKSRRVEPDLKAIRIDKRYGVIFSRYDLSCALEQHSSPTCHGYIRDDAARIVINVILYSLHD